MPYHIVVSWSQGGPSFLILISCVILGVLNFVLWALLLYFNYFYTVEFNSPLLVSSSVKFSGPCFIGIVIYFPFYFGSALALLFCV